MVSIAKRPGTLTFVAVVLFGFAAISSLSALSTGFYSINIAVNPKPANAAQKIEIGDTAAMMRAIADEIPGYVAISLAIVVLDLLFAAGQFYCAMGILRLRPSARKAAIWLILVRLLYVLGYDGFETFVVVPIYVRVFEQGMLAQMPAQGAPPMQMFSQIMSIMLYAMMAIKAFVEIFAAFLMIILLSTMKAKNAFAGVDDTPETTLTEDRERQQERERTQYSGYEDEFTR